MVLNTSLIKSDDPV